MTENYETGYQDRHCANQLAQLVECWTAVREVSGSGVVVWSLSVVLVGVGNARHISISLFEA